ncbi:hypothetical protein LCGC14_0926560 [marine sediment metagenome]|uniref:Uncharacterized protein n=1 Tax=marine sediment metagenome TaxID=412755 RepID=A0A0F9NU00_9ZZZZ
MNYMVILKGGVVAATYALVSYSQKALKEEPEDWDNAKAFATLLAGLFVGLLMAATGDPISQETVLVQIGAYGGLTAFLETFAKIGRRLLKKWDVL